MKSRLSGVLSAALLVVCCSSAFAADTPHSMWLKAKCALCHGEDGSGNTPAGHSLGIPDLRSASVQKRTDSELAASIKNGHSRMPSFRGQLNDEQVALLVAYIRLIAKQ